MEALKMAGLAIGVLVMTAFAMFNMAVDGHTWWSNATKLVSRSEAKPVKAKAVKFSPANDSDEAVIWAGHAFFKKAAKRQAAKLPLDQGGGLTLTAVRYEPETKTIYRTQELDLSKVPEKNRARTQLIVEHPELFMGLMSRIIGKKCQEQGAHELVRLFKLGFRENFSLHHEGKRILTGTIPEQGSPCLD